MNITNVRVLRGPSIWSTRHHFLLQVRLNSGNLNFGKHTDIAELYGQGVLRLQRAAGIKANFLKTKPTAEEGIWQVAVGGETEEAARYAAEAACELTQSILENREFCIEPVIEKLRELHAANRPEADQALLSAEARRMNIPVKLLDRKTLQLGYGKNSRTLHGTSVLNKAFCNRQAAGHLFTMLKEAGISVTDAKDKQKATASVFRILVINGRVSAATGVHTVSNSDILPALKSKQTLIEVTAELHPANRFMAERIAAILGLDICGIEISAPNLTTPVGKNGGAVLNVESSPALSDYLPTLEARQNAAKKILQTLYPEGTKSRIPIFAVTGTNGKTTTTRLLRHLVKNSGYCVGYTTTDGVYIGDHEVCTGDCTGPASAGIILRDPKVDFAILETARGGLLRGGLAFDTCDVAIVTNIQEDHLGLNDINNLEDLAHVKGTVPRSVKKDGWAVLNAEDPHCLKLAREIEAKIAFFSMDAANPEIQQHVKKGGLATVVEKENVVVYRGKEKITIAPLTAFPLTMNGTAKFMTANILAATAAAFAYGFSPDEIRHAFETFVPGAETTPGRMNLFKMNGYKILVDYAHNTHGVRGVSDYLSQVKALRKIGIVSAVGDRRDKDIIDLAAVAAGMFDFIIVRQDSSLRGRSIEEMCALMRSGIQQTNAGVDYMFIDDEGDAIRHAIAIAQPGDFIVALSEEYRKVIDIIENEKHRQNRPAKAAVKKSGSFSTLTKKVKSL